MVTIFLIRHSTQVMNVNIYISLSLSFVCPICLSRLELNIVENIVIWGRKSVNKTTSTSFRQVYLSLYISVLHKTSLFSRRFHLNRGGVVTENWILTSKSVILFVCPVCLSHCLTVCLSASCLFVHSILRCQTVKYVCPYYTTDYVTC